MSRSAPFEIDLADLDDVRRKIPEVDAIVEEKRQEVSVAQRDLQYWLTIQQRLQLLAGATRAAKRKGAGADTVKVLPITRRVVDVVNALARPVRAEDVRAELGSDVKPKTVSWSLWKAEQEGQIKRISPGVYAPTSYDDITDLLRQLEEITKE